MPTPTQGKECWMGGKPRPDPSIVSGMKVAFVEGGSKYYFDAIELRYYSWDSLHGEFDVFDRRGFHLGSVCPDTGTALQGEIDQFVEDWHEGREGADLQLHQYLGMTWEEYQLWATTPSVLPFVLTARKRGTTLEQELAQERFAMAARASSVSEAARVEAWLRSVGKI